LPVIDTYKGACHQSFRTEAQAQAFIEDWKESMAEVCRMAVKEKLDSGVRSQSMELDLRTISIVGS
jgi:hypothetical protein